jgi:hypothetical protein
MNSYTMNVSEWIFRFVLVITTTLAVLTIVVFPFQQPGSGSWVVSIVTLVIQCFLILVAGAGIYFGWEPFQFLEKS